MGPRGSGCTGRDLALCFSFDSLCGCGGRRGGKWRRKLVPAGPYSRGGDESWRLNVAPDAPPQDDEEVSEFALDGLKQVMAIKSRVVLPYLVPKVSPNTW